MAEATDAAELFSLMMKEITQPDIPPEVKEVRVMSLHKSKGLSSPYVFVPQCIQGVLPQIAKPGTPKAEADAALEEQRRLFFVGITRVKAGGGHVGSLFLTYPREMGANTAKGLSIPFTKVKNGMARLTPSMFIQELGPSRPPLQWRGRYDVKIAILSHGDVAGYYAATLMERGHQVTISGAWLPTTGYSIRPYTDCDGCLIISDDADLLEIADYMEAAGKKIWRNLADVPA